MTRPTPTRRHAKRKTTAKRKQQRRADVVAGATKKTPCQHKWAHDYDCNSLAPASAYGLFCILCGLLSPPLTETS